MLAVETIASRAGNRRAFLVGAAGVAATAILMNRIAVAGGDCVTAQCPPQQRRKSRTSMSTLSGDAAQSRQQIGAHERPSLPPYFPLE